MFKKIKILKEEEEEEDDEEDPPSAPDMDHGMECCTGMQHSMRRCIPGIFFDNFFSLKVIFIAMQ